MSESINAGTLYSLIQTFGLVRYNVKEGYIEELSTCFYLDTALLKSSESGLSETWIFNIKMIDTHFKS